MTIKSKTFKTVAAVAIAASTAVPTLVASTDAHAACYSYGGIVLCDDGSSYMSYGNSYYGYNSYTGTSWGGSTYGNSSFGYSYYGSGTGGTNWSYAYYGGYGSGYSWSWGN